MNKDTLFVAALLAAPLVYVLSRIVFSAYFTAKTIYQRQLLKHLEEKE